ncbi:hypothetical protein [Mesorhizobium sp. ES1-1]|uniref:hypothetical protein n=1 Tax=Mesorhizobium sp. ES1-1 TaxID=2876629 RepID=UPI001CCDC8E8|nr:hypothetical protein [Mesorhizobium sp. ES1-1]MBZ9678889.1 hypothetical protein [Mesorhizobium sp. ES1-1]
MTEPRFVPTDLQRMLEMSSSGVDIVTFITIAHPNMAQTAFLAVDDVDYLIDGQTYQRAKGVKLKPLTDTEQAPRTTFSFPNVDYSRLIGLAEIVDPAKVTFFYAPDTSFDRRTKPRVLKAGKVLEPFWRHIGLNLTDVSVSETVVSGTLRGPDYSQEQHPSLIVTQELFPGAYLQ